MQYDPLQVFLSGYQLLPLQLGATRGYGLTCFTRTMFLPLNPRLQANKTITKPKQNKACSKSKQNQKKKKKRNKQMTSISARPTAPPPDKHTWALGLNGTQHLQLRPAAPADVAEDRQLLVVLAPSDVGRTGRFREAAFLQVLHVGRWVAVGFFNGWV